MAYIKGNIDETIIEAMLHVIKHDVMHYTTLAKRIGRSESWVRFAAEQVMEQGRSAELENLRSRIRGTKIEIPYVEQVIKNRAAKAEKIRRKNLEIDEIIGCRHCGMIGQLQGQSGGKKRTVCDSCMVDHDMRHNDPDHTRTWRDDPRWAAIIAKRHQARGGCAICGSSRAQERDGRYCDWRHDPVMLTPEEFEALLERHAASAKRYDIWGNPVL